MGMLECLVLLVWLCYHTFAATLTTNVLKLAEEGDFLNLELLIG